MIIDCHSHIMDPKLSQYMVKAPHARAFEVSQLLDKQQEAGIDLTIISHPSVMDRTLQKFPGSALEVAKIYDESVAELASKHKGRLAGLAITYPHGGDPFLKELERAVKELGLKGVMVNPNYGGEFLDSPRAVPFLELVCQLDIPVYLHPPTDTFAAEHMRGFRLMEVVGRPFETTLGLARLIYYGVMERFPRLKVVAAHLGGGIMMLAGRLNCGYETRYDLALDIWGPDYLTTAPSEYLKRVYVDTVSWHPPAVRCAIETVGLDHVMLGSDFPPVPMPLKRSVEAVLALRLPPEAEAKILGDNAAALFRIGPQGS
jgi:aminocarboxymuconate-semialdehyde decarboxylase